MANEQQDIQAPRPTAGQPGGPITQGPVIPGQPDPSKSFNGKDTYFTNKDAFNTERAVVAAANQLLYPDPNVFQAPRPTAGQPGYVAPKK